MPFVHLALAVGLYALAMAYVEAAVVVDLNAALGQQIGEFFPTALALGQPLIVVEVGREIATLVMLGAVGWLAGRLPLERIAWGAVAFGAWDIGYYGWLRVLTGWPPAADTWDVLFVVPPAWTGPVWAPLAVSAGLVFFGLVAARRFRQGGSVRLSARHIGAGLAGGLLVIVSFTMDAPRIVAGGVPGPFPWPVFAAGMIVAVGAAVDSLWGPWQRLIGPRLAGSSRRS